MIFRKSKVSRCEITYSSSYGKLFTCPCIKFILFVFDVHWYSICVDCTKYNLRAGGGLRIAGWETLRACKELGFTSVSGWSKSPSHSCGLKSVAFLHTARGGRWCGRRREAPSPVLLLLSDPLPSSRHRTGKNSRVWTYFHRLDWLPAVITSWSSKWRIVPLCWLFFGIHTVLTYGQVKTLLFLFQIVRTCRFNWNGFFEILTELERGPQFSLKSRIFTGEGALRLYIIYV